MMSEKLCLQWNDFKENVESSFKSLRQDIDFTDVTLACKDGQEIQSHKVILAASSPIFRSLLNKNKQNHIFIYMRGVKMDDLAAILDFLYFGEANVYQHNLDSFLALAEELQLKGLKAQNTLDEKTEKEDQHLPTGKAEYIDFERLEPSQGTQISKYKVEGSPTTVSLMTDFSGNIEKLGQQVSSMHYGIRAMGAMTLRISDLCLSFSPHPNISDGNFNLVHHFLHANISDK